jgi:hypothetical protein
MKHILLVFSLLLQQVTIAQTDTICGDQNIRNTRGRGFHNANGCYVVTSDGNRNIGQWIHTDKFGHVLKITHYESFAVQVDSMFDNDGTLNKTRHITQTSKPSDQKNNAYSVLAKDYYYKGAIKKIRHEENHKEVYHEKFRSNGKLRKCVQYYEADNTRLTEIYNRRGGLQTTVFEVQAISQTTGKLEWKRQNLSSKNKVFLICLAVVPVVAMILFEPEPEDK